MSIIIRVKHTGERVAYYGLIELYTDFTNIHMTIESTYGWKTDYSFNKKDYEIAYII